MKKMWQDAVDWADQLPRGVKITVGDVERAVIDRAPYILHLRARLQGFWSVCLPRSPGNQALMLVSGLGPIAGPLALAGDVSYRNIQSHGFEPGVGLWIACFCLLGAFVSQVVTVAGWLRTGRRARESDSMGAWMILAGSALAVVFAAVNDAVGVGDIRLWPAWAALVLAGVSVAVFRVGGSDSALPAVDVSELTEEERQALVEQRDAALKIAAKRQVVRSRTVNRAVGKPLGSLIARQDGSGPSQG